MTNEHAPSGKPASTFRRADEWAGLFVKLGNIAIIVASVVILIAWIAKSTVRGHLIELLLLLIPLSVSVVLVALPRGNRVRALWSLLAFVLSPAAIVYLTLEASAAYSAYKNQAGDEVTLQLAICVADLVLWMSLLLIFLVIVNEQHFRVQRILAETHDGYVESQAEEKDNRIVILEQAVASLKRRISEKDGY